MLHHMATILVCYGGHFQSKMANKIQKSSDLDEIWFPNRLWCCELISIVGLLWWPSWIQNGCQNTKILRLGRNLASKYIMMLQIDIHRCFTMVAILNPKWPPKYKNPPIWTKFGFQVDYDVANWYPSLVYYGGHVESKMDAKIQKSSDLNEIWFPSRLWCCKLISIVGLLWWPFWKKNVRQNVKILRFGRNLASK